MLDFIKNTYAWAQADFRVHPVRFTLELLAWIASMACAITMAFTLPHPPFLILYPLFIAQCAVFGWAAWTRRSLGMLGNYALLVSIDTVALVRLLSL